MTEKLLKRRQWKFTIGAILTSLSSAIIGFLNIGVFYLFGIPLIFLLTGLILVWLSKKKLKTKILFTFLPFPIIVLFFFLSILSIPKAEPEVILIPQSFRGQIAVIFDESCGQIPKYENGKRIYDFSESNILITKLNQTFGRIDRKFFLVDEQGNRIELPEFHWSKFKEEQTDWHWTFSKTPLTKDMVGVFWAYRRDFSFIISDYATQEGESAELREENRKLFQDKLEATLKQCRQGNSQ